MAKTSAKDKLRARGDAAWCVRKHCGGAIRHATETNQKLGRNIRGDQIKVDKATIDEANALIQDLDQIEYHIQSEVLPQLKKRKTKDALRKIDKKARKIRQNIAQTNVIFYDTKKVDADTMDVMEKSVKDLKFLLKDIDKAASSIMTQEQINCDKCVEDFIGSDGLKAMKKRPEVIAARKKKSGGILSRFSLFGRGKKRKKR